MEAFIDREIFRPLPDMHQAIRESHSYMMAWATELVHSLPALYAARIAAGVFRP